MCGVNSKDPKRIEFLELGDEQIAEGDKVVTRWTGHGTHQGELAGIPATGKSSTVTGVAVDRIVNGKITESWGIFDEFGMMQQLGAIPMPELAVS